ncbi:ubiquitin carboxyl-terminal hydrolase 24-like isoform X2 [Lytechinus variegatus]|uniref:ubiquitin carboxyl-terminal hydrolase 24-like isoform X2 n=1 Tax=Lytechinus variegatus TaxID=7654 RepID=UPI001BB1E7DD|nr:ubiquitin carboxyl-terminal hydrolase 24-like isoform X2 [Lytechinus variegatus]
MEPSEENVQMLINMGFGDLADIKKALRLAQNDVNEAVAILTQEQPGLSYDTVEEETNKEAPPPGTLRRTYGPQHRLAPDPPPPSYDEAVEPVEDEDPSSSSGEAREEESMEVNKEFPTGNLYELEGRVFTDQWSIPYKKEESLGKCLIAATRFASEGRMESDENCMRFVNRCMPEAFRKLLTSKAVHRWGAEIHEGIYNMLQLLIELVAVRLKHKPVPLELLEVLAMAFNPETEFHYKNRAKKWDHIFWEEKFGVNHTFAVSPPFETYKDPCGWLVNLINAFAHHGGMDQIRDRVLESIDDVDPTTLSVLMQPLGYCGEYLNPLKFGPFMALVEKQVLKYVQDLKEHELKRKKTGSISELLTTMKSLCLYFWVDDVKKVDDLRMSVALRMLNSPHFNAKMNSLKEITKMIEDTSISSRNRNAIEEEVILDWLVDNKVLSRLVIALEGNIDQSQYADKLKGIVEFLGPKLSIEDLTKIWKMQNDQPLTVVDNIHSIMAAAAVKFSSEQLEHLFHLIQKAWKYENERVQEKLLSLIGRIGRDARSPKTTCKVLELLWDLAHLPAIPKNHMEHALEEHLFILSDSLAVGMQIKNKYVAKCVDDIKRSQFVVPAMRQIHQIAKGITKQSYSKSDKSLPQELNKAYDIIKLTTQSLMKCHKMAINAAGQDGLSGNTVVDGKYTHCEHVEIHLKFLAFILQEGALYLHWHRAREIWDTLVANPEACEADRETCYEWFRHGLADLETETQMQLFKDKLLRLESTHLSPIGFDCVRAFFESINMNNHSLRKGATGLIVEKLDLFGLDFMWKMVLESTNESIAEMAIRQIMSMSYTNLSQRLKKDVLDLHKHFISECYKRLELAYMAVKGTAMAEAVAMATKTLTAATVPEAAIVPCPSRAGKLLEIERLLQLAETYVVTVEDQFTSPRTILPHGASFQGHTITMHATCTDSHRSEFVIVGHSNETLQSVRHKIAQRLKTTLDNVQIMANDRLMLTTKDQKLLSELEFDEEQDLNIKLHGPVSSTVSSSARIDENMSSFGQQSELERSLPGVVMATGGQVFDMLYQLADLDEPRITERVRKLLMMIPTDPSIPESLDSICRQTADSVTSLGGETSGSESNKDSSRATLEGLFRANSTHGMSAFRVLYNLEVLSSKLMPSMQEDIGTQTSAQNFRESFLNAGGLSLVINALQKDSIPQDVDDDTRRGCYSICLQLARFLLCGQTTTDLKESDLSLNDSSVFETSGADSSTVFSSSYGSSPRKMSLVERMSSVEASGDLANREGTSVAITVIQTMNANDFTSMIACLMRVTWAAAAGHLRLASGSQPIKEVAGGGFAMGIGRRSRHSSAGSTNSSSSHDSESQALHAGICLNTVAVSGKDADIAREALELLVACLQLRTHNLGAFYNLPGVNDFIIDILLSSPHPEVRGAALEQFYTLTSTSISNESVRILHPRDFMLQVLLQARVPLWTSSSLVRGANQRILNQSAQYFELRCRLLEGLRVNEQKFLKVNIVSMLGDEIDWLHNFEPGDSEDMNLSSTDNTIVAGHLHLIRTLLTCEGVDKRKIGERLLNSLLNEYLFPASRLVMHQGDHSEKGDSRRDYNSKISGKESRVAAFELLVVLCEGCPYNLQRIASQLINMHHQLDPSIAKEWEFLPPVEGRMTKYVGLKNGGATCYMNSVIQQLYMTPGIREGILAGHTPEKEKGEDSIFYQMQNVFGHLLESKLQYYEPERFWKVFKFWGEPVNIREQQDAFDFFTILTDQLDEYLKQSGQKEVMKQKFQGLYLNQMICQDCPHRKEREEEFFALNLTVKSNNLNDSLEQFVRGEMLEGENAYLCEECNEKRNTIKRTCIKTLPPVLVIQLKRFGYDWEAGRALKFDDYFKFPWVLDMEPFTSKGMARREQQQQSDDPPSPMNYQRNVSSQSSTDDLYQLVGVVVHSGQANAGHYYSFIKDRGGTSITNISKGKWFRFNDTQVEEFIMSDAALEAECFGGSFRSKSNETSGSYGPENRLRTWSGYMLFYEKMEGMRSPDPMARLGRKGYHHGDIHGSMDGLSSPELSPTGDRMSELSALVHKGEKRGFFMDKMPAAIQRLIEDENLQFLRNRAVYNQEYFTFVRKLASCSLHMTYHPAYSMMALQSIKLAMHFVFNTLFRTKKKLRYDLEDWRDLIDSIVRDSPEACEWALELLASSQGRDYLRAFLLECPNQEVRMAMAKMVKSVMQCFVQRSHDTHQVHLDTILEHLLSLLDKEVLEHCRSCVEYFWLLSMYLELGSDTCEHLFRRKAFHRLITFLIGPPSELNDMDIQTRRWTSLQTREFGFLHTMLAAMVLHTDVSPHWSVDLGTKPKRRPILILENLNRFLPIPEDMRHILFGPPCLKYIKESVLAFREVHSSTTPILDMLLHCSFCNQGFTLNVMMIIHSQVSSAPSNELKAIFVLLLELLLLDDPLQLGRLKLAMEGNDNNGLFSIIRNCTGNDSRRSYQCIKFLVHLSNKSPLAKEYLTSVSQKWHWAVNWLKKKMTEHYWNPQSSISNESSTSKGFQRTMSAQDTLAEATALLTELTTQDEDEDDDAITKEEDEGDETTEGTVTPRMEVNGSSEGSEVNGNSGEKPTERISGIDDVDG